ncbi:MAG TPA: alginate lyase family protein [Candidatus Binatia bacterium]|nr:alginate lyase family protein [Candidatus Binatia bacterium]
MIYQCNRRRGKTTGEVTLELLTKHLMGRTVHAGLVETLTRSRRRQKDRALLDASLGRMLRAGKLSRMKFFFDPTQKSLWTTFKQRFPDKYHGIIREADKICRHEFDLLGSGRVHWGERIDWDKDPKTGYRWPKKFYVALHPVSAVSNGADVKLPYEINRLQHLPTLGKAYALTRNEHYAGQLVDQLDHWIKDNPYLVGINWTSAMEAAIRVVNILWGVAFIQRSETLTVDFLRRLYTSLWEHGQYILRHLEYSIRPDATVSNHNHYLAGVVGLVYLGVLFPEFAGADAWLDLGVTGLAEEMQNQVHPDGVNYESSTAYHRFVLELFTSAALLCRMNNIGLADEFWKKLEKMYSFTLYATRQDGKMPQIGDTDDGRLHILSDYGEWDKRDHRYLLSIGAVLFNRADMKTFSDGFSEDAFWLLGPKAASSFDRIPTLPVPLSSKAFHESGFYIMRSPRSYMLVSCNAVGSAGKGNHKHNDLLSFELYLRDRPFIVDPGSYVYTADPLWRNRFRSTHYHNTVKVDGEEQNRLPSNRLFQLFPDSQPIVHRWHSTMDHDWLDAEHTGYLRLPRPVTHRRAFRFDKLNDKLEIADTLTGSGEHRAAWYFHFDHGISVKAANENVFLAAAGEVTLAVRVTSDSPFLAEICEGWISRSYGTRLPAKILKLSTQFSGSCRFSLQASCL